MQPIGLVLAGGVGSRMGQAKGAMLFDGATLADRAAEALAEVCERVLISIRPGTDNPAPRHAAVADLPPAGRGPLAGIASAFAATGDRDLLVLACDYPRVGPALLGAVLRAAPAAAAVVFPVDSQGRDHPLVGLWRGRAARAVERALEQGRHRVADLLRSVPLGRLARAELGGVDVDRLLVNVNRPADLRNL